MERQFRKGDKVRIRFREYEQSDYKFNFTDKMASLGGRIFTIKEAIEDEFDDSYEVEDDNYRYFLAENPADEFTWSSGMLEHAEEIYDKPNKDGKDIKSKIRKILYSSITEDCDKISATDSSIIHFDYPMWADSPDFRTATTRSTRR